MPSAAVNKKKRFLFCSFFCQKIWTIYLIQAHMVRFCNANDSNQWSLVFSPSRPIRWQRKLATPYEIVKPPELLYRNETMAGTTLQLPISGPQTGPWEKLYQGVPRPIPEPLASGALAGTYTAYLHSSHNIDKTANMLRYAVEVDYLLFWQLTYTYNFGLD